MRRLLVLGLLLAGCGGEGAGGEGRERVRVERVVDGDTIRVRLAGVSEPVRYIGMDTPEPDEEEPCAGRATARNEELVGGREVTLVWDVERRDRYGRLLAYVEAPAGFVNAILVREGLAEAREYPPNTARAGELERLERKAGLWSRC